jgi:patatin-like phospholipase/acyl hydrolase
MAGYPPKRLVIWLKTTLRDVAELITLICKIKLIDAQHNNTQNTMMLKTTVASR